MPAVSAQQAPTSPSSPFHPHSRHNPAPHHSFASPDIAPPRSSFARETIDDLIYRVSAELDRQQITFDLDLDALDSDPSATRSPQHAHLRTRSQQQGHVSPGLENGTPKVGIYARDGLWDDDDSSTQRGSTVTSTSDGRSLKSGRTGTRSRSGTVSTLKDGLAEHTAAPSISSGWSWGRKSAQNQNQHHRGQSSSSVAMQVSASAPVTPAMPDVGEMESPGDLPTLRKSKSKTKLRGKGRRGELSVAVEPSSETDTPPMPQTPGSFLASPALTTATTLVSPPSSYPTRFPPSVASTTPNLHLGTDFAPLPPVPEKSKSSWKRGMEKLFKSKSSTTLRDAYKHASPGMEENVPPTPSLSDARRPSLHLNRGHGAGSTPAPPVPVLGESRYPNLQQPYREGNSAFPPASAMSDSFGLYLPSDPFASSLDIAGNNYNARGSLASPGTRPRSGSIAKGPKPSTSLRDLKAALHIPTASNQSLNSGHRPKLSKAKSLANMKSGNETPASAPPFRTHFDHYQSPALGQFQYHTPLEPVIEIKPLSMSPEPVVDIPASAPMEESASVPLPPRPTLERRPTESPPLQPPRPHFLARAERSNSPSSTASSSTSSPALSTSSSSSSKPGLSIDTSASATLQAVIASPVPKSPLPPLPTSASAPPTTVVAQGPMKRSISGAVVLPRSRSTSLSLKGPPTSSSFFDLYEQLGIWPGASDDKTKEMAAGTGGPGPETKESEGLEVVELATATTGTATTEAIPESQQQQISSIAPATSPSTTLTESPSATFSSASWEAAISAFPLVDDSDAAAALSANTSTNVNIDTDADQSFDFGLPYEESDKPVINAIVEEPRHPLDLSTISRIANASLSPASLTTELHHDSTYRSSSDARDTSLSTQGGDVSATWTGTYYGMSGRASEQDGAGSTREPSQDRQIADPAETWFSGTVASMSLSLDAADESSEGEGDEDDECRLHGEVDDVPLSQLHPQAAAAQRIRQADAERRRALRRAARKARIEAAAAAKAAAAAPEAQREREWDGEGGVPADALTKRLHKVALGGADLSTFPAGAARPTSMATRDFPWAASAAAGPSRSRAAQPTANGQHANLPQRAMTDPVTNGNGSQSQSVSRQPTVTGDRAPERPERRIESHGSIRGPSGTTAPLRVPRVAVPPMLAPVSTATSVRPSVDSTRSAASGPSPAVPQRSRSRAMSTAASTARPAIPTAPVPSVPSTTTAPPAPPPKAKPFSARCFIGTPEGKLINLDIHPDTTARDVLSMAKTRGDIADTSSGMGWVVSEVFHELGFERHVREYEQLQAVVRGWDTSVAHSDHGNYFILRQSNRAVSTWARTIPSTTPFVGAHVQYESKPGKWSKRWLETRGGQVFLAKNDKNKDEVQINTAFIDVYSPVNPSYPTAPKAFVFAIKRNEPMASFENPAEHVQVIACDESTGWKLLAAIYDARSFILAQTQPHLLAPWSNTGDSARAQATGPRPTNNHGQVRPAPGLPPPLVDIKKSVDRSAFTGRGLLKI